MFWVLLCLPEIVSEGEVTLPADYGAAPSRYETALHIAARLLTRAINSPDGAGSSERQQRQQRELMRILLNFGADATAQDVNGNLEKKGMQKKAEKTIKSRLEELYNAVMQASKWGDSSAFGQVQLVWGTSDMLGCFKGLFAFVFIHKLWCSLYIQLRRYPSALQRSHWRCLGFLLAVAKRGWSENGSSYQQCLRGGRVEQHQWLNSSTANSCKDSSSDVAFEATDQTLHGTRPIARLKKLQHKPDPIILVSCSALSSLIFGLPKRRNNLAHTLGKNPFLNRLSRHLSSFCLGWGWGTPSSLWRWWRFAEWFLAALSYFRDPHLTSRVHDCYCRKRPRMKVKKSKIHKARFFPPVSIAQSIQPVLHLCLISDWLNMNYLTRQTRHVMLVGP